MPPQNSGNKNQHGRIIYQDNNGQPKKKVKVYSSTKVKVRNLLTNLSYSRWNNDDFNKSSFTIDILTYFLQYFNLSGLDRKLETEDERNQVKFVWEECLPDSFTQYILKEENYQVLGLPTLNYQKCFEIINNYLMLDLNNNQNGLVKAVKENLRVFRYVYATLFPKIYSRIDADGIKEKLAFEFKYHNWWNKKYNSHYSPEHMQCAQDLLDGDVENVVVPLAKNPASVIVTNRNVEQQPIDPSNEKFVTVKKTVLSKPKMPKEQVSENAEKRRQKRKMELEKRLAENDAKIDMIKRSRKIKKENSSSLKKVVL